MKRALTTRRDEDTSAAAQRQCCVTGCPADGENTMTFIGGTEQSLYITFPTDGAEHHTHNGKPICARHTDEAITAFEIQALTDGGEGEAFHVTPAGAVHTSWKHGIIARH